jgi:hypothetical protein
VKATIAGTDKPLVMTEFGQFCCDTNGECYQYPGSWDGNEVGYVEALLMISQKYHVSWFPWSWRPNGQAFPAHECQDINGDGTTFKLAHPTDGEGADWQTLWDKYANVSPSKAVEESVEFLQ